MKVKVGIRKPSLKKSFKARTTGAAKRKIKRFFNPLYGKKGMGWLTNPKKAAYNKVYRKTTIGGFSGLNSGIKKQSGNRKSSKSSETPGCIVIVLLWIILSFVITYFWTIIGILGGIIVAVVAYMFFRKSRSVENKNLATESEELEVDEEFEELKQYVRIVLESQNIVNESANIDVVVSRLDLVVENMKKISSYNNVNLYFVGMTREYVLEKLDYILANYDVMIEQGLARAYLREIDRIRTLKTEKGKYHHMMRFFDDLSANKKLNENHHKYLLKLKFTYIIKSANK